MKPLHDTHVTIGVTCFNNGRWIKQAVESALAQTYLNREVIVVDDGSTDDSPSILRKFGNAIQYVRTVNQGPNPARNEILKRASGEYIQFLDGDDYLLPFKIEKQAAESGLQGDIVYSPVLSEVWQDERCKPLKPVPLDAGLSVPCLFLAWQLPQTGAALWRTSTLRSLEGWGGDTVCDENELYMRAIFQGHSFQFAPTPGAAYRLWDSNSRSRRDPIALINDCSRLIVRMEEWMKHAGLWDATAQRTAGRKHFQLARTLAQLDLSAACEYHDRFKQRGLLHLSGSAAPLRYRVMYAAAGFRNAELAAAFGRKITGELQETAPN